MSGQLECGCWFKCYCAEKEAAEKARVLLKMADLNSVFYPNSDGTIVVYVQPYERWTTQYGGKWRQTAISVRRYTSVEGLRKGISQIIQRKTRDPSYLDLPLPDPRSKRFNLPSKSKKSPTNICRLVGSQ